MNFLKKKIGWSKRIKSQREIKKIKPTIRVFNEKIQNISQEAFCVLVLNECELINDENSALIIQIQALFNEKLFELLLPETPKKLSEGLHQNEVGKIVQLDEGFEDGLVEVTLLAEVVADGGLVQPFAFVQECGNVFRGLLDQTVLKMNWQLVCFALKQDFRVKSYALYTTYFIKSKCLQLMIKVLILEI